MVGKEEKLLERFEDVVVVFVDLRDDVDRPEGFVSSIPSSSAYRLCMILPLG